MCLHLPALSKFKIQIIMALILTALAFHAHVFRMGYMVVMGAYIYGCARWWPGAHGMMELGCWLQ